jgi:hypothetical protein
VRRVRGQSEFREESFLIPREIPVRANRHPYYWVAVSPLTSGRHTFGWHAFGRHAFGRHAFGRHASLPRHAQKYVSGTQPA